LSNLGRKYDKASGKSLEGLQRTAPGERGRQNQSDKTALVGEVNQGSPKQRYEFDQSGRVESDAENRAFEDFQIAGRYAYQGATNRLTHWAGESGSKTVE